MLAKFVARIAAVSKSQRASDCNRNSWSHCSTGNALRNQLFGLEIQRFCLVWSCFGRAPKGRKPPSIPCSYKAVIRSGCNYFGPMCFLRLRHRDLIAGKASDFKICNCQLLAICGCDYVDRSEIASSRMCMCEPGPEIAVCSASWVILIIPCRSRKEKQWLTNREALVSFTCPLCEYDAIEHRVREPKMKMLLLQQTLVVALVGPSLFFNSRIIAGTAREWVLLTPVSATAGCFKLLLATGRTMALSAIVTSRPQQNHFHKYYRNRSFYRSD